MSRTDKRDPSDERDGGEIINDACCEGGACCWHDNTNAQSEGGGDRKAPSINTDISGGVRLGTRYPSAPGGDD